MKVLLIAQFGLFAVMVWLSTMSAGAATYYVDINSTNPTPPFTNWSMAATDIQSAVDESTNGDLILVNPGVYRTGGEVINGSSLTNRVVIDKDITLKSVDGPASTIIEGNQLQPSPIIQIDSYGNPYVSPFAPDGPNAVRCICATTNGALIGFMVADGATLGGYSSNTNDENGGGIWCAARNGILVSNCVIAANSAYNLGGGVYQGTVVNSTILGNFAGTGGGAANAAIYRSLVISNTAAGLANSTGAGGGGGTFNCAVFSSAIAGNFTEGSYSDGGGAYGGTLVNCTVTANTAVNAGGGAAACIATNSIIYYNKILSAQSSSSNWYSPVRFSDCCTTPSIGPGNITADPGLADISHISTNSPCRGSGSPSAAYGTDIDGNPWNSSPSIGCSEIPSAGDYGNLAVNIAVPFTNWAPGYPLNFQTANSGPDYESVWNFGDGTLVTNTPYLAHAWTAPGTYQVTLTAYSDSYPTGVTAAETMIITVPSIYYVNNANPTPVPPYMYWSTASSDIQDAVNVAVPGSTVLVTNSLVQGQAPYTNISGVYETGGARIGNMFFRVAITNPITVESVNGPGATSIDGGFLGGDSGVPVGGCVYMTNGAVLSGFTLTNGNSSLTAGGVLAGSTNDVVTNCIITHCQGGAYSGTFYNCLFFGNSAGATTMSTLNDCVLTNNSSQYGGGACGGIMNDCLILNNTATYGGGAFGGGIPGAGPPYPLFLNHCVISNNTAEYGGGVASYDSGFTPSFTNCIATNCTLAFNTATYSGGGAYDAKLNNCLIFNNDSAFEGGGAAEGLLANCTITANGASVGAGAALSTLNQCTLTFNSATLDGGGAWDSILNQCLLAYNSATQDGGGAAGCTLNNSEILTNQAYDGGGYYCVNLISFYGLTNCVLAGNTANYGGGADGGGYGNGPSLLLTPLVHCTLTGNFATNTGGGAIQCTLEGCLVFGNLSDFAGAGAAYAILNGCMVLSNTAMASVPDPRNPVSGGGGAYSCTVTNCVLADNFATTNGGGAFQSTLVNCTVTANTAAVGGGVFDSTSRNSILYYNDGGDYNPASSQYPLDYCCTPVPVADGIRNITNAPQFVDSADGDFHLQAESPCINSGENAYIAGTATDLDGDPRIQGGTVDIGAYEYQTPTSTISYAFLQQYGLPMNGSVDRSDLDGTGFSVYQDWIAGLNPTNSASVLAMLSPAVTNNASGITISWQSVSGIPYLLQRSTNLTAQAFATIQNVTGQDGVTSYTDTSATNNVPYFYRVGVTR